MPGYLPARGSSMRLGYPRACSLGLGRGKQRIGGGMADIDNGDVLRIGTSWIYDGDYEVTNVWHALCTSGAGKDFADIIDDVQEYVDALYTEMDVFLSTLMLVDRISIANVTQRLIFGSINYGVLAAGGLVGDPVPAGACLLAWARTLKSRVQIRKYYGVCGESVLTGGVWTGPAQTAAFVDLTYHINSNAMTDGLTMTGVAWNRLLETYTLATGVATAGEPAYQRRRRRGRGS